MALQRAVTSVAFVSAVWLLAAGCTGGGVTTADVPSTSMAPPPNVGSFVAPNYHVLRMSEVQLEQPPHPADVVVVSAGPGVNSNEPVQGGTEDVQVLSYDNIAARWNVAFDAADKVVSPSNFAADSTSDSGMQPLLPQADALSSVVALPVRFLSSTPQLVIYGLDESVNHPAGLLGVLDMKTGTPTLAYYDSEVDMSVPTIDGPATAQRITISAEFTTTADPACCPVRQFHQVIGSTGDPHAAPPAIGVLEDDRPWLGVWYVTPVGQTGEPPIVAGVMNGSPASAVLQVGDRLLGVANTSAPPGDMAQPAVVDQVAVHRPGDHIVLRVERQDKTVSVPLVAASYDSPSYQSETMAPQEAMLGVDVVDAPSGTTPGVIVQQVLADGASAESGLMSGDDITAVGSTPVMSLIDLQVALMGQAGRDVALAVRHLDGTTTTVSVIPKVAPSGTGGLLYASEL
jgi:hypothetical protein